MSCKLIVLSTMCQDGLLSRDPGPERSMQMWQTLSCLGSQGNCYVQNMLKVIS